MGGLLTCEACLTGHGTGDAGLVKVEALQDLLARGSGRGPGANASFGVERQAFEFVDAKGFKGILDEGDLGGWVGGWLGRWVGALGGCFGWVGG